MTIPILKIAAKAESDLLVAKFRVGQIAEMSGLSTLERTQLVVACSEVVRNALTFAGEARIEFSIRNLNNMQFIAVTVSDSGPGFSLALIKEKSGLSASKKLVNDLLIESDPVSGSKVTLLKAVGKSQVRRITPQIVSEWIESLKTNSPFSVVEDLEQQNKQLIDTLQELELYRNKLEDRTEQLNQANKYKAEFLANMSHEIRTPMNAVLGLSNILERTALNYDQKKYLRLIKDAGNSLLEIINDILDFSKIEAGKLNIETIEFELFDNIETCVELLSANAQSKGLALVCGIDTDLPKKVLGDGARLRQILVNLISNAIKFTSSGGQVIVKANMIKEEGLEILVRFEVIDSGIGLSSEQSEKLFQPFVQADGSTTRKFGGTGLGLSICKQLSELMNGRIGVDSVLGAGSTFWFELPFGIAGKAKSLAEGAHLLFKRALIVDDNPAMREIMSGLLKAWHLESDSVSSAREALDLVERKDFDLFILDYLMPEKDGLELAAELRKHEKTKKARLLLLTALQDETIGQKAINGGCDAFLTKPVRQDLLLECLCSLGCNPVHKMKTGKFFVMKMESEIKEVDSVTSPQLEAKQVESTKSKIETTALKTDSQQLAKILLVEDNPTNQIVANIELTALNLDVAIASNGKEALEAVSKNDFAIVFMDCQMPVMDGYESTKQIRKAESRTGKHVPIIAMTANAMEGDREKCISAGMDDYISKPFDPETLQKLVEKWLPQPQAAEEPLTPAAPKLAVLDFEKFCKRFNEKQVKQLLTVFLADTEQKLPELHSFTEKEDLEALAKLAHSIKGAASMIFADALAFSAKELEAAGKRGESGSIQTLTQNVQEEFERLKSEALDKV